MTKYTKHNIMMGVTIGAMMGALGVLYLAERDVSPVETLTYAEPKTVPHQVITLPDTVIVAEPKAATPKMTARGAAFQGPAIATSAPTAWTHTLEQGGPGGVVVKGFNPGE